jgi:hypothetical protein
MSMPIPNSAEFELELPFLLERRLIQGTHGVRICQAISQPPQTQNRIGLLQEQARRAYDRVMLRRMRHVIMAHRSPFFKQHTVQGERRGGGIADPEHFGPIQKG